MLTWRRFRVVGLALIGGGLATTAMLWTAARPARAMPAAAACIPLLQVCPTATTKPTTPPTTKAPVTTTPATAPTTSKSVRATTTTAPTRTASGRPASVGAAGLPAPAAGPGDLSSLGAGADPAAPQLAATPAPSTTVPAGPAVPPVGLPALVGTSRGLPDDHATARFALSFVVLLLGGLGAAQLPAGRRRPRPDPRV